MASEEDLPSTIMSPITGHGYGFPSEISSKSCKEMELCIFLCDGTGHEFMVENCKRTSSGELCEMIREQLCLPRQAKEVFCLWLISPLLKLQLKPHHVPFKLYRQWKDLLNQFTSAKEDQKIRDEPLLCYQRNAFFPLEKEQQITDDKILNLLYEEAKDNMLDSVYPVEVDKVLNMAALIAHINLGPYNPAIFTAAYFRDHVDDFVPAHMCKLRKSSNSVIGKRVQEKYMYISTSSQTKEESRKKYLQECWVLPFYGAVFFTGQIERPNQGVKLLSNPDRPVHVAINRQGVHVICVEKCEILLALTYDDLSWEYTEPRNQGGNRLPCLWLQFDSVEEGRSTSKILQVFSRQAVMMNAMIEVCVEELNRKDMADTTDQTIVDSAQKRRTLYSVKDHLNRLSLTTITDSGNVIPPKPEKPEKKAKSRQFLSSIRSKFSSGGSKEDPNVQPANV